ncbi:hypothetical protein AVEN_89659-1 [Araneus ventricosus]|uniref:Uncharacterized protein n=1 Tax=Araneus ventricosus TaxID=182803 RepID=A0A4Y2EVX9_ARAVE|nr:hypothetical protein AVEN_89659-1 [Araneus ventricosus]
MDQVDKTGHSGYHLLFVFSRRVKASKELCRVRRRSNVSTTCRWLSQFKNMSFDFKNNIIHKNARTTEFNENRQNLLHYENPPQTTWELTVPIECAKNL